MIKAIIFLIFLLGSSLLIYINAITFCLLLLYLATLLNLFISLTALVESFIFLHVVKSHHLQIKTVLLTLLGFEDFCFSCLTSLARNFSTTLKKSNESGDPCLSLDVREDAFSLSSLSRFVIYGFNYVEICSLYGHPWDSKIQT